jgi:hypothetical protein
MLHQPRINQPGRAIEAGRLAWRTYSASDLEAGHGAVEALLRLLAPAAAALAIGAALTGVMVALGR